MTPATFRRSAHDDGQSGERCRDASSDPEALGNFVNFDEPFSGDTVHAGNVHGINLVALERDQQRRILAERDQTMWVRHDGDAEKWHLIAEIACGAIFIACSGSMPVIDKPDMEARPARADRCAACQAKYIAHKTRRLGQLRLDRGLVELRDANAAPLPRAEVVR